MDTHALHLKCWAWAYSTFSRTTTMNLIRWIMFDMCRISSAMLSSSFTITSWRTPISSPRTFSLSIRNFQRHLMHERWELAETSWRLGSTTQSIVSFVCLLFSVESWSSSCQEHGHKINWFWKRDLRPWTSQYNRQHASLSCARSDFGAWLVAAMRCLVDRMHHVWALPRNHTLPDTWQSWTLGDDGANLGTDTDKDGEVSSVVCVVDFHRFTKLTFMTHSFLDEQRHDTSTTPNSIGMKSRRMAAMCATTPSRWVATFSQKRRNICSCLTLFVKCSTTIHWREWR